jgi:DNA ligase (NAD+)
MPARCPECRAAVVRDGPFDRCPNGLACPAQLKHTIRHFASRDGLDIRGLGPSTVGALVSAGRIRSVADLFALSRRDLLEVERFGEVSAANLLEAIEGAKHPPLWRFLNALGIPGVGAETARVLAAHVGTLERLRSAPAAALMDAPGIGPATARNVAEFFRAGFNRRVIEQCLSRGVHVIDSPMPRKGPLAGKTMVFTGGLQSMTRQDAEARAHASGARTARHVSSHTDLVVAGTAPGSNYGKARTLGIRIIDERQFQKLVGAAA